MKLLPQILILTVILTITVDMPVYAQQSAATVFETRLSGLEEQMRLMNGQIEQVGFATKKLELALQRIQTDYDARLTKLEADEAILAQQLATAQTAAATPPPTTTTVPTQTPESVPDVKGSLGAVKVQNGKVVGGVNNPKSPPLPEAPADYGLTPQEQYDRAFDILRKADYAEAEKAFKNFIDKNPKDKLAANAKYWYGETLYVQNKYNEAAVAFVDAYQQNPKGTKAPDSLLKLGLSLSSLNKIPDACATLVELKTKYPGASATVRSRASEELTKLKCSTQQ